MADVAGDAPELRDAVAGTDAGGEAPTLKDATLESDEVGWPLLLCVAAVVAEPEEDTPDGGDAAAETDTNNDGDGDGVEDVDVDRDEVEDVDGDGDGVVDGDAPRLSDAVAAFVVDRGALTDEV